MVNTVLIILMGILFGIGYKCMAGIDGFMEKGGFSKEEDKER